MSLMLLTACPSFLFLYRFWPRFCFKHNMQTPMQNPWAVEIDDLIRGACGGFLFGIPLMYTMEVWWIGSFVDPPRILLALAATYGVLVLLNRTAGFRNINSTSFIQAMMDSIEVLALGLLCAAGVMVVLREITLQTSIGEALGKIVYEGIPFALGAAIARLVLHGTRTQSDNDHTPEQPRSAKINATLADIGATLIGAIIIAFNISPTDEVPMLAAAVTGPWLILLIGVSLVISYGIVFEAGFRNEEQREQQQGILQRPDSETLASYLVALLAAAAMLWFFDQLSFDDPWTLWLRYTLILGLPATIGGAAGRLAV